MQRNKEDDLIRNKIERMETDGEAMLDRTDELWKRIEPTIYTGKSKKLSWIYYPAAAILLVLFCVIVFTRKKDETIKMEGTQTKRIEQAVRSEHYVTKAPPQPDIQAEKNTRAVAKPNNAIPQPVTEYQYCDDYTYCDGMPDANDPASFGLYATIITEESNNLFLQ